MSLDSKQPIDRQRDSAGSMEIGLEAEGTITGFYKVGDDRLFIVKDRATYEMQMADTIDPQRSNEKIPNVQQRIFDAGSENEAVQAVLLQSDDLLHDGFLKNIDLNQARLDAIDATGELLAMGRIRDRIKAEEDLQLKALIGARLEDGTIIPFLHDAVQDTKNFLNRTDHFMKSVRSISKIFLGRFKTFEALYEREKKKGVTKEEEDIFEKVIRYAKFIREARNASEHHHEKKHVLVRNFRLLPTAEIASPTFEFVHPKFGEPEVDLPIFMDATINSLMNLYGAWLALLCSRNAKLNDFSIGVMHMPVDRRRLPKVAFSYALPTEAGWQPLG